MEKLALGKKIIWAHDQATGRHYGYGRDNIRYVVEAPDDNKRHRVFKEFLNQENYEDRPHALDFLNFRKNGEDSPIIEDFYLERKYSLEAAQELCAHDYTFVTNPQKLSWIETFDVFHAHGVGKTKYLIQEIPDHEKTSDDFNAVKDFALLKESLGKNSMRKRLVDRGCAFYEAMDLAQKDYRKALERKRAAGARKG